MLLLVSAFVVSGCAKIEYTHVKPGQSARSEYMTRNAPTAVPIARSVFRPRRGWSAAANHYGNIQPLPDFVLDPGLPEPVASGQKVSELFTQGSLAMEAGQTGEAILAMEQVVQIDPNFTDAWGKLVTLYKKAGNEEKSKDAQKHAKKGQSKDPQDPRGPATLLQ